VKVALGECGHLVAVLFGFGGCRVDHKPGNALRR
jgi:hypothetical protein